MVYLLETELNEHKSVYVALQSVYGLGKARVGLICKQLGFAKNLTVKELTYAQKIKLTRAVELNGFLITSELRKRHAFIIKQFLTIKRLKGLRRIQGLPVRGQRTHTNAKSARVNNSRK